MIEKIINIKNVGRFHDCNPCGDVSFRKLTIIYAENGRGKTTLCAILRSLQTNRHEFISERKTLGANGQPFVLIRLGGNNFTFGGSTWSTFYPNIAIFDSVFVHENVYAGDYVSHDHKKNLYSVIVGIKGVQLAKRIEELDEKTREASRDINIKRNAASSTLPNGVPLESYLAWQQDIDIDRKIEQKTLLIANRQRTLEKAKDIQNKSLLQKVELPVFPSNFLTILSKQLPDITADAEAQVRQQIANHSMESLGETWLSQGIGFITNNNCPFCGQGISANELLAAYNSYFNIAYKSLKHEVAQLSQRLTSSIGELVLSTVQHALSNNLVLFEFWSQFSEMNLPAFPIDDVFSKYATLRDLALAMSQKKQQTLIEPVLPDSEFEMAMNAVEALIESIPGYNAAVETCNSIIKLQKELANQGVDIAALKREVAELEAIKKRFEPEVDLACKECQNALIFKADIEQEKAEAKQQLDQYCKQILQTYEFAINKFLDQFSAGFRITNSRHSYAGGTPSSHYQIQINNNAVDLGDSRTESGTPCFKTTLSSGDRSALALAFFLAAINQDVGIRDKIVVFDDPFTSQDRFRRTCTQQLISQLVDNAKQVVVLSHDPHFLKLLWENCPASNMKTLQMCRTGNNSVIGEWDIEAATQSTYLTNYSALLDFYREHKGTPLNVAQSIRPFMEGLLRAHFPGYFLPNEWLGEFIDKIRNAGDSEGLSHAKADLSEIEAINEYSKKYHHEQNPNANSEPLSEDELHGYVKRTLRLVGGL